jgi:cyclic pyranopterin phosphate synthase
MVDVGAKPSTHRTATARAVVRLGSEAFRLLRRNALQKGDALAVARIAGIMAAKQTGSLIPLCHPIPLTHVAIKFHLDDECDAVEVEARAACEGRTGVEMEALTAASIASLVLYDMCKAITKGIVIERVRLVEKTGGKSGHWTADDGNAISGDET